MSVLPIAKFKQPLARFGAVTATRRLNFSFNVYAIDAGVSAATVRSVIAGALSGWALIGGTSGVSVTPMAGQGFFSVTLSANVSSTYPTDQAGRALADDLGRVRMIVSALRVGGDPVTTGGNIYTPTGSSPTGSTYTVRAGDTLSKIAARYGTTWQALAALNGLSNPNVLDVGQVIRVLGAAAPVVVGSGTPIITTPQSQTPTPTPTPNGSGLESWAAKLGLSASALILLAVVGGMVVVSQRK